MSTQELMMIGLIATFGLMLVIVLLVVAKSIRRGRPPEIAKDTDSKPTPKVETGPDIQAPAPARDAAPKLKVELETQRKTEPTFQPKPVPKAEPTLKPEPVLKPAPEPNLKPVPEPTPEPQKDLKSALSSTKQNLWGRLKSLIQSEKPSLDDLEEVLYTSDLGPQTVERLMEQIRPHSHEGLEKVRFKLREEFQRIFDESHVQNPSDQNPLALLKNGHQPTVWMIVGVNGAGKTTTIGKLSALLASQGKKVLVAAGDTFRAAAGSQLKVWADRAQVEIFHPEGVTDPAAVAFDAVTKAKARGFDMVLIDTAGRLHTQSHLMDELKKIKRVITKVISDSPHETLIVLDANNGQNALFQAKEFHQALGLTGIVLTKMDGTAKGGVALAVAEELKIPIRLIGVGEKIQDLRAFSAAEFIDSILSSD